MGKKPLGRSRLWWYQKKIIKSQKRKLWGLDLIWMEADKNKDGWKRI